MTSHIEMTSCWLWVCNTSYVDSFQMKNTDASWSFLCLLLHDSSMAQRINLATGLISFYILIDAKSNRKNRRKHRIFRSFCWRWPSCCKVPQKCWYASGEKQYFISCGIFTTVPVCPAGKIIDGCCLWNVLDIMWVECTQAWQWNSFMVVI